eukprot:TRINITY_DN42715_c0_g1_i1.p1 TRINITY_DN42715_c0_g1~~TRINITY_DN42715_c0_g1_i1.p1  ORF type:complete len:423 (+),score=65.13 TRINITY_DN42715_c0_g1_i1:131-1270(+)
MAAASTRDQKLAKLDAMLSKMTVTVSSVDQRIFKMRTESAGNAVHQRHLRASVDSVCSSRSASTSTATPSEFAGRCAEHADELSPVVSTTDESPSESRCTTEQQLFSTHRDDDIPGASAFADFCRVPLDRAQTSRRRISTASSKTRHARRHDTELASRKLDLALGLAPAATENRDAESLTGDWVDSDGSAVQVKVTSKTSCVVSISRPPLQQLQLSMWQSSSSGWHCGDAALDSNQSTQTRLMWRFPCGRVSVWMRQKSLWDGWHEQGSWLPVWETEDGYGPWAKQASCCDEDQDASASMCLSPASTPVCRLDELAFFLSGGQSTTMMMPQVREDGTMALIPATGLSQAHLETKNGMQNIAKVEDSFVLEENDFPALMK